LENGGKWEGCAHSARVLPKGHGFEGEHLFSGINLAKLGFTPSLIVSGENATHVLIKKKE
jgi:hypothetical protein